MAQRTKIADLPVLEPELKELTSEQAEAVHGGSYSAEVMAPDPEWIEFMSEIGVEASTDPLAPGGQESA